MILGVSAVFILVICAVSAIFASMHFEIFFLVRCGTTVPDSTIAVSQKRRTFAPGIQNQLGLGFGGFCV